MCGMKFHYSKSMDFPEGLAKYIQQAGKEEFVNLPSNKAYINEIKELAKKYAGSESVVVAGIGGSNLGAMAVWRALHPQKQVDFAETLDARRLRRLLNRVDKNTLLIVISKSGTTAETVANAAVLMEKAGSVVAITDEGSKLWSWAEEKKYDKLSVPKDVGGRYSVFSAVGLFPLVLAGVNIDKLLKGAQKITPDCLSEDASKNPAAQSALAIYENYKAGKTIHDTFIFEPDLEYFGRWYRQLVGESLGKEGKGITPTVSVGTTDLHSVAQLYLGGPKDKFTTFVSVKNHGADFKIPAGKDGFDNLVPGISGKKFSELLSAVLEGVKTAYQKQGLPYAEIELPDVSEESLGELLQMKMLEVVYLGKLMDVNAFDEPQVELYKEEVRKLLRNL